MHYFTSWIDNAAAQSFVADPELQQLPKSLYTATQRLDISFMTQHPQYYPQLSASQEVKDEIAETEQLLSGRSYRYIPKSSLNRTSALRQHIHQGDIIVILTKKKGLDTSHIGIASWHSDGTLHLLNASQIRKKVVDDPMTLYQYMQKHPSQIGIRVIHPL